jgi:hypothetical protein
VSRNWGVPLHDHSGELDMYAAIFSLGAALLTYAGVVVHGTSAPMASGFFIGAMAMALGAAIDVMSAGQRAAVK